MLNKYKTNVNIYKLKRITNISNLRIVSMSPGDREVARCFIFLEDVSNGRYSNFC
jgi:hypothetical protein